MQQELEKCDQELNKAKFDPQAVRDSELFQINMRTLRGEPRLQNNQLFKNLINRLEAFYILAEKHRKFGPTSNQAEQMRKSGF